MATTLLWGAPSNGKSYIATMIAIAEMLLGRRVFSSYPIIYIRPLSIRHKVVNLIIYFIFLIKILIFYIIKYSKKCIYYLYKKIHKSSTFLRFFITTKPQYTQKYKNKMYSTYKWEHSYTNAGLNDCCIIIDEGYLEFNCHEKLPIEEHTFFATSGHNNNDIYIIAQNYSRINIAIRELANYFIYVYKFSNPFSVQSKTGRRQLTPLFFTVETYIREEDFKMRNINPKVIWERKRVLFNKNVAKSYDTQYYKLDEKEINPQLWITILKDKEKIEKKEILGDSISKKDFAEVFPELLEA